MQQLGVIATATPKTAATYRSVEMSLEFIEKMSWSLLAFQTLLVIYVSSKHFEGREE